MSPVGSQYDRALAYAVIAALAVLSAPRRPWLAVLLVVALAVGLEIAQRFTVDRHANMIDVVEKLVGASIGVAIAYMARWALSLRRAPTP